MDELFEALAPCSVNIGAVVTWQLETSKGDKEREEENNTPRFTILLQNLKLRRVGDAMRPGRR